MRLLKRMKPNQLRDLSKAAAALEKEQLAKLELERQKRENKKKVSWVGIQCKFGPNAAYPVMSHSVFW